MNAAGETTITLDESIHEDESNVELEVELPNLLFAVLDKIQQLLETDGINSNTLLFQITVLDQLVSFLRVVAEDDHPDQQDWIIMAGIFAELLALLKQRQLELLERPNILTRLDCGVGQTGAPGRPSFNISTEMLEDLRGYGFSWTKIAQILGVSRWTIHRRVRDMGLGYLGEFTLISDSELENLVADYINRHGHNSGQTYIMGYLRSLGIRVQRHRVRECIVRLSPENAMRRWGMIIRRRQYHVPWPNSLWHLDGNHALIRWSFVVHGCIDGFSRRVIFLQCSTNNLSETVLSLFLDGIERDGGLWPSRIRVDRGVENVLVCDAMVDARGEGRGSFIAGPSTHNQRIERLWRDVFRCVLHFFYYVFYAMEDAQILFLDNPTHVFTLHYIFLPRINQALHEYMRGFNEHGIRTANNWSPNQMWINGMLNEENPLAHDRLDETPEDLQYYGYDPQAPSPFENSDNNVVVSPIYGTPDSEFTRVLQEVDPLRDSNNMGIDVYLDALTLLQPLLN